MGQKILGLTNLFGRPYFWLRDGDGVVYLTKAKERKGVSVNGQTGETTEFTQDFVPDFS